MSPNMKPNNDSQPLDESAHPLSAMLPSREDATDALETGKRVHEEAERSLLADNGRTLALKLADSELADLQNDLLDNVDYDHDGGSYVGNAEARYLAIVESVRATLARIIRGNQ